MKMKRFTIGTMAAALLFSGCTTKYEKSDIKSYVSDQLGLKDVTVSATYEEWEDEDGYTDKIWTVVDEQHDVTFHVVDDYYWGMEALTNLLYDDYGEAAFQRYQDQLPESSLMDEGRLTITSGTSAAGCAEVSITALYADRAELQKVIDALTEIQEYFKERGLDQVDPAVRIQYEGTASCPCKGHMVGGETFGLLSWDMDQIFDDALTNYILTALDYRFDEVYADTTEEERQEVILADNTDRVGIVREDGETEYYDDLIGNRYSYGLSVSTLYTVLEREGLQPAGDQRHFTWTGADGTIYEFSCDFVSTVIDGDECAYYLAGGVPVMLSYAYNIHITAYKASQIFGITIQTDWNKTIAENKEKASSQSGSAN